LGVNTNGYKKKTNRKETKKQSNKTTKQNKPNQTKQAKPPVEWSFWNTLQRKTNSVLKKKSERE